MKIDVFVLSELENENENETLHTHKLKTKQKKKTIHGNQQAAENQRWTI